MVSSIDLSQWDLNNDGVANAADLTIADQRGMTVSAEVRTALTNSTTTISQDEDAEVQEDDATTAAKTGPSIPLPEMPDVTTYTTSAACQPKIDEITAYIAKCTARIAVLDTNIANVTKEIAELTKKRDAAQKEYDTHAAEIAVKQAELTNTIKAVTAETETFSTDLDNNITGAVNDAIEEYNNGEHEGQGLDEIIQNKISSLVSNPDKLNSLVDRSTALGMVISQRCGELEQLGNGVRNLNIQIFKKNAELTAYQSERTGLVDAVATSNTYLTKLKARQAALLAAEQAAAAKRRDPIGFEKDGVSYDFIVDRDQDNVFDGSEELLGAKKGWKELTSYDTNNDGKINGEELEKLNLLKTDSTGKTSFSTAEESGIKEIDLSSYSAKNQDLGNGNTLLGNFNLNFNGQTVQGYNTLDSESFLDNKYGAAYGKTIDSDAKTTQNAKNVFINLDVKNKVNTEFIRLSTINDVSDSKTTASRGIFSAQTKKIGYKYSDSASVESNKQAKDDAATQEVKVEETKQEETKKKEEKTIV